MSQRLGARAVIVGGGMGGLFAARTLADHFDEVVIVDRDSEPTTADPRGGVPQGSHFHVLLPGGLVAMEHWFPGFVDELIAQGSIPMGVGGADFVAHTAQGVSYSLQTHQAEPMEPFDTMYVQTRPALELLVRGRVAAIPNVSFRYGTVVDAPVVHDGRVCGVTVRDGQPIDADLVVDASGRNSVTPRWLDAMGCAQAPETYVNCDVHYASVMVRPDDWDAAGAVVRFIMPTYGDDGSRFGAIVKMSEGRWLVGLGGRYDIKPPTDWDEYRAFGAQLHTPIWSQLVDQVTPVGPVVPYRLPRAVRHHYDQLSSFPEGLLPIGDAVCFFNPTHGQGMSSAAGQCRGLEELLDRRADAGLGLDGLALEFFDVAREWVRGPWLMAALGDFADPQCTGDFPEADLPDLNRLVELVGMLDEHPEIVSTVLGVSTLQLPLGAVNDVAIA
jgi:2-polyprenyl-6-methoxyphenol hydroxylase-like FAD-dependent oxidoreductase